MTRPFVFINVAASADGKIDTVARRGAALSSPEDKERVDRLRAGADAVMVGGHTLLGESPKLTVKSARLRAERLAKGLPENPAKVGVVTRASLPPESNFLQAGPARRLLFTTPATSPEQVQSLEKAGTEVFVHTGTHVDLAQALERLSSLGVRRLMVEGGGTLNFALLRLNLVDELTIYVAPLLFGGAAAPTTADGSGLIRSEAIPLKLVEARTLDQVGGVLLRYRLNGD